MITIKNENLTAQITEMGAELRSLKKDGKEYIWCGNPEIWSGTSPVLFPILGALKDDKFIFDSKEYYLSKHGFALNSLFKVEKLTENSVTFLLTDSPETLKSYPFKFEFRVIFTVINNSLSVEYKVKNLNDYTMYFSVGAHEAYEISENIEDCDLIFEQKERFDTVLLDGSFITDNTECIAENTNVLPLLEDYFKYLTLIFKDLKSKSLTLLNRKDGTKVKIDIPDSKYLGIWHVPNSPYVCIEPWNGLPDHINSDNILEHKKGIILLSAFGEYSNFHKLTL